MPGIAIKQNWLSGWGETSATNDQLLKILPRFASSIDNYVRTTPRFLASTDEYIKTLPKFLTNADLTISFTVPVWLFTWLQRPGEVSSWQKVGSTTTSAWIQDEGTSGGFAREGKSSGFLEKEDGSPDFNTEGEEKYI